MHFQLFQSFFVRQIVVLLYRLPNTFYIEVFQAKVQVLRKHNNNKNNNNNETLNGAGNIKDGAKRMYIATNDKCAYHV